MNDYIETVIQLSPVSPSGEAGDTLSMDDALDIVSALLAEAGYESFEKRDDSLHAYVRKRDFSKERLAEALSLFPFSHFYTTGILENKEIAGEDWNSEWEKNYFKPYVFGDNKCVIHSTFHTGYPQCQYDVVIDPKMAFGTGHHSTTRLMVQALFDSDIDSHSVLDVGTGSAVLAILAAKLGASRVLGVEIDEAAYVNARENTALNACEGIELVHGVITDIDPTLKFDFVLANINRNIILEDIRHYAAHMVDTGRLFVSGFYESDVELIEAQAMKTGLKCCYREADNSWAILGFCKIDPQ